MVNILIIAEESEAVTELHSRLAQNGFVCSITSDERNVIEQMTELAPNLVLVEVKGHQADSRRELCRKIKQKRHMPIIALLSRDELGNLDGDFNIDDFVLTPSGFDELLLRVERLLERTGNASSKLIKCDDLVIDLARCDVSVADRSVMLTFKEYELLKFLTLNRGRVFTRDALLNRVWGYDYYGGDRTVDVHIRRLRSKIEDPNHTFIETVRNIGYRFKKEA